MIREEVERLLPEISHWAKGGVLYWYDSDDKTWEVVENWSLDWYIEVSVVIEDQHFEARKADALGEPIEVYSESTGFWGSCIKPLWSSYREYRPKPKEPTYDYHFTFRRGEQWHISISRWQNLKEAMHFITGEDIAVFEPSKRLRK